MSVGSARRSRRGSPSAPRHGCEGREPTASIQKAADLVGSEVERVEEAEERREARVAEAALDLAEVLLSDAGARGQLSLAEFEDASPLA